MIPLSINMKISGGIPDLCFRIYKSCAKNAGFYIENLLQWTP